LLPSEAVQLTSRCCRPPPHAALHCFHAPVCHAKEAHGVRLHCLTTRGFWFSATVSVALRAAYDSMQSASE